MCLSGDGGYNTVYWKSPHPSPPTSQPIWPLIGRIFVKLLFVPLFLLTSTGKMFAEIVACPEVTELLSTKLSPKSSSANSNQLSSFLFHYHLFPFHKQRNFFKQYDYLSLVLILKPYRQIILQLINNTVILLKEACSSVVLFKITLHPHSFIHTFIHPFTHSRIPSPTFSVWNETPDTGGPRFSQ